MIKKRDKENEELMERTCCWSGEGIQGKRHSWVGDSAMVRGIGSERGTVLLSTGVIHTEMSLQKEGKSGQSRERAKIFGRFFCVNKQSISSFLFCMGYIRKLCASSDFWKTSSLREPQFLPFSLCRPDVEWFLWVTSPMEMDCKVWI